MPSPAPEGSTLTLKLEPGTKARSPAIRKFPSAPLRAMCPEVITLPVKKEAK